jgi:hypothetical protein
MCIADAMYERAEATEPVHVSAALLSECSTAHGSPYLTDTDTDGEDPVPLVDQLDQLTQLDSRAHYSDDHFCAAMLVKHELLRTMFAVSKVAQLKKEPLSASVLDVRQSCVHTMQRILHFAFMSRTEIMQESAVIQSILLLDWIIANEHTYFMHMKHDVLSGVCVLLNCDHMLAAPNERQELFRIVSEVVYGNDELPAQRRLAVQVARIEQQVLSRYRQIFFTDYIEQYVRHDPCAMGQMVHGLYLYMTQTRSTWLLNTYETFVEVALKQTSDVQTHIEIMDDYLVVCV